MAVDVVVLVAVSVVVGFICFVASISTSQEIELVFSLFFLKFSVRYKQG